MTQLISFEHLTRTLQELADDMRETYKAELDKSDRYTTERSLINSVRTEVVVNDRSYEVIMRLNDYWRYVEDDTRPHWPPPSAILRWVIIKPVVPRPLKNGKIPKPAQLAYLIGRKISQEGTTGSHDLQHAREQVLTMWTAALSEALRLDVEGYILATLAQDLY